MTNQTDEFVDAANNIAVAAFEYGGTLTAAADTLRQFFEAREKVLREALAEADKAIAEYYRYWTGGETRGSYDGKPERQGLWNAHRKTRTALETCK